MIFAHLANTDHQLFTPMSALCSSVCSQMCSLCIPGCLFWASAVKNEGEKVLFFHETTEARLWGSVLPLLYFFTAEIQKVPSEERNTLQHSPFPCLSFSRIRLGLWKLPETTCCCDTFLCRNQSQAFAKKSKEWGIELLATKTTGNFSLQCSCASVPYLLALPGCCGYLHFLC